MKHVIQHNVDLAQSKRVADRALKYYEARYAKYDPQVRWLDDRRAEVRFKAKGMSVTGTVELLPGAVAIDLDVPFLFRAFRGTAIRILEAEIKRLLAEAPSARGGEASPPTSA
jgi:hypothetical protein